MNLQGKRIAVTGASGFLGRYIVKSLLKRGAHVVAVVRNPEKTPQLKHPQIEIRRADLSDREALTQAFKGCDAVVSNVALFRMGQRDWNSHLKDNVEGTENVFRAIHAAGVKRVVQVSSVAVYRKYMSKDLKETAPQHLSTDSPGLKNAYPISKAISEQRAWALSQEFGLEMTAVRPCGIFGAYDPNVTSLFKKLWSKPVMVVPGSGMVLCFVYAGDVAEGIALALEKPEKSIGKSYNLTGLLEPMSEFYRAWKKAGLPSPKIAIPAPIMWKTTYDYSLAEKELGYQNRTLESALRETAQLERDQVL